MKRKIISALTAAVITAAGALDLCSFAAGDITFDFDGDGRLSVYDLIIARQKGESAEDLGLLQDFLLGKDPDFPGKPDVPSDVVIDESCILEPKGTVHTGDGTYYGAFVRGTKGRGTRKYAVVNIYGFRFILSVVEHQHVVEIARIARN